MRGSRELWATDCGTWARITQRHGKRLIMCTRLRQMRWEDFYTQGQTAILPADWERNHEAQSEHEPSVFSAQIPKLLSNSFWKLAVKINPLFTQVFLKSLEYQKISLHILQGIRLSNISSYFKKSLQEPAIPVQPPPGSNHSLIKHSLFGYSQQRLNPWNNHDYHSETQRMTDTLLCQKNALKTLQICPDGFYMIHSNMVMFQWSNKPHSDKFSSDWHYCDQGWG